MRKFINILRGNMSVIGLVLLMTVSFCYAMFQGGFVSWFIFYSFLPFSVYALILLVYPLHDFTVERKVNKRECQAGESVEMALTFSRKNRLPLLFMVVEEELPQKLEDRGLQRKIIIFPGFKRTFSMSYVLEDLQRGEHSFQSIRFWVGDFFGLVEKEAIFSSPLKITVFPRYHELAYSDLERVFNQGAVVSAKKTQREHSVVSGVREYQPGDQLSWINWKATARTSEIMTKEFEVQKNRDVFIMLDEKPSDLFEESIEMAASIAHALLKKGMEIGYVSRESRLIIPAAAGNNQKRKIFYRLVKEEPRVANDLNENVRKGILPANAAVIFIVSDLTLEKVDILSALRPNLGFMLCVKKQAYLTEEEKLSSSAAVSRGIKVRFFEHGQLKSDRSEVMAK